MYISVEKIYSRNTVNTIKAVPLFYFCVVR